MIGHRYNNAYNIVFIILCTIQLQKFGGDVQSAVMRAAEIVNGIDSVRKKNCMFSVCMCIWCNHKW